MKIKLLSFFLFLPLIFTAKVYAGNSTTDVTIETNGETKTFHTEGNQNVNWQSDDGKSNVSINNNVSSSPFTSPVASPAPTASPAESPSASPSPTPSPEVKSIEEPSNSANILDQIRKLVSNFIKQIFD